MQVEVELVRQAVPLSLAPLTLEDDPRAKDGNWYKGWESVPEPRDLRVISDTIINTQTGTGNRIEFWDSHGTPFPTKGKIRRYIDIGRLNKGR